MIKFCTFLIILFTSIQFYAISTEKIVGNMSLEALRQLFFLYMLGLILFSIFIKNKNRFLVSRYALNIPLILFFAVLIIGIFRTPNYFYGIVDIVKITYVILATMVFMKFFSVYQDKNPMSFVDKVIIIAFLVLFAQVILNILLGRTISPDTGWFHISGLSGRPLSAMLCSILSIYFYNNYLFSNKLNYFILFLLGSILVFLSVVRIAIAGFLISFLLMSFYHRKFLIPIVLSLIASILMLLTPYIDILREKIFLGESYSIYNIRLTGREVLWPQAFASFLKSPLIGNGTGYSTFEIKSNPLTAMLDHVHSDYIKVLNEHGIIGILLYLGIYLSMFRKATKIYLSNKSYYKKAYILFVSTLIQIIIFSLTDTVILYAPYILIYLFLFYNFLLIKRRSEE